MNDKTKIKNKIKVEMTNHVKANYMNHQPSPWTRQYSTSLSANGAMFEEAVDDRALRLEDHDPVWRLAERSILHKSWVRSFPF
jgi:hypothetical protein